MHIHFHRHRYNSKRELEYRIPRLHYPVKSWRFPEIFRGFCENKTSFLNVFVENLFSCLLRRKPEPVPRAQALSETLCELKKTTPIKRGECLKKTNTTQLTNYRNKESK